MQEFHLREGEDFIKLGQVLKAVGLVGNGAEAKENIQAGFVLVNDTPEYQRGKKLHEGDTVTFQGETIKILK